jgi:hypothetical protein
MPESYQLELKEDPAALIARITETAREEGLIFEGDTISGKIHGKGFNGTYEITEDTITVTIDEKPTLIPWFLVRSKITGFLG